MLCGVFMCDVFAFSSIEKRGLTLNWVCPWKQKTLLEVLWGKDLSILDYTQETDISQIHRQCFNTCWFYLKIQECQWAALKDNNKCNSGGASARLHSTRCRKGWFLGQFLLSTSCQQQKLGNVSLFSVPSQCCALLTKTAWTVDNANKARRQGDAEEMINQVRSGPSAWKH